MNDAVFAEFDTKGLFIFKSEGRVSVLNLNLSLKSGQIKAEFCNN